MTLTILPNAKTIFVDGNGVPLADGKVYFYVPNTLTFKTTWQNYTATIENTNPVELDSDGGALIWGSGIYRQIVKDADDNEIWDQITLDSTYAAVTSFSGTSTTSVNIGTGSKSFTTQPGLAFFPGGALTIASAAAPSTNYMVGIVTSYNTSTGALVVNVTTTGGSGTHADWIISIASAAQAGGNISSATVIATGATTARTLANYMADVLNIKDFGAVGDGTTDDSTAIQAAIDATSPGGNLFIPVGTYKIATGLTCNKPIRLYGSGLYGAGGARLKYTGAGTALTFNTAGAGLICENFTIDGVSSTGTANGILIDNIFNSIRFTSVYVESFAAGTAVTIDDGFDMAFYSCNFRYSSIGVKLKKGVTTGVINNVKFYGCGLANNATGAIIEAGANNVFDGCDFSGCTSLCVSIAPALAAGVAKANAIRNCYIEPAAAGKGIEVGVGATTGASNVIQNIITGNYMAVTTATYIKLDYSTATFISDNSFGTVSGGSYSVDITANSSDAMITINPRGSDIRNLGTNTLIYSQNLQTLTETAGNYAAPQRSAFSAVVGSTINNVTGNGAAYTIIFDTEITDRQSEYNNATGVFTALKTGLYQLSAAVTAIQAASATTILLECPTSNRNYNLLNAGTGFLNASNNCTATASVLVDMDAGDTASIRITITGVGANTSDIAAGSYFMGSFYG